MGAAGYATGQDVSGKRLHCYGVAARINVLVEMMGVEMEEETSGEMEAIDHEPFQVQVTSRGKETFAAAHQPHGDIGILVVVS